MVPSCEAERIAVLDAQLRAAIHADSAASLVGPGAAVMRGATPFA